MQLKTHITILLCGLLRITQAVTLRNAEDGFYALQQWYNESNGLWVPSTGWWNSANCELYLTRRIARSLTLTDFAIRPHRGSRSGRDRSPGSTAWQFHLAKYVHSSPELQFADAESGRTKLPYVLILCLQWAFFDPRSRNATGTSNERFLERLL